MMLRLMLLSVIVCLIVSCEPQKDKIDYERLNDTTSLSSIDLKDTTKMLVADLPVKFDSTTVLISAVRLVSLQDRDGLSKIKSSVYEPTMSSSHLVDNTLIGDFENLVFQDKDGKERKLTDERVRLRSVNFLREIYKKTGRGYLLYFVSDRDTNRDGELNNFDVESLYISNVDGTDFVKITKELHELYDYKTIKGDNRIYFRTLEDKNKDGKLTNWDKFHYYIVEFNHDKYDVVEYNPLKIFGQQ